MTACVLLGLTARTDVAYGAVGIDPDRKDCKITFNLSSNYQQKEPEEGQEPASGDYEKTDGYGELMNLPVVVKVYKAADVDASGRYIRPQSGNVSLYEAIKSELAGVSSETAAAEWMDMAEKAAEQTAGLTGTDARTKTLNTDGSGNTMGSLMPGLYLVAAEKVVSEEYIYTFTPYLVSLPGNNYYSDGDDEWQYEVEVGLKASQENRFGDLRIEKTLDTYNASLGETTAIFRIDAVKGDFHYSDVVSVVFQGAGTQSVLIKGKIPPKAAVTVEEIYSGASYQAASDIVQTAPEIIASDEGSTAGPSVVRFSNTYDPARQNSGTSIVNHFTKAGNEEPDALADDKSGSGAGAPETRSAVWDVQQLRDSNDQSGGEQQ